MAEQLNGVVRAAGGVVWRTTPTGSSAPNSIQPGSPEVLVVHRPKYDDWSLPKGKLDAGESDEDAARREVEEETGLRCQLGVELPASTYQDPNGRPKVVRYWAMTPVAGRARAVRPHEVDELRWLPLTEARALLTHQRDQEVLDAFARARSFDPSGGQLGEESDFLGRGPHGDASAPGSGEPVL